MNCVGGSHDGRTVHVRSGLRHGSVVDVPRFLSSVELGSFDKYEPVGLISEVVEVYRCFEFHLDGIKGICLVTNAWTDEMAWEEIKARFSQAAPR